MSAYELHKSSVLLTSKANVPSSDLSIRLRETSESVAPYYKPLETISIEEARTRRSTLSGVSISAQSMAELLFLSMFDTKDEGRRPYPAAGGVYTVQMYLLAYQVKDLAGGVYFVRWSDRNLEKIGSLDAAVRFREEAIFQEKKESIGAIGLLVSDARLARIKYHDRAWRMGMIEAGALLQTLYLAGSKLSLPICGLGAISDRAVLKLCRLQPSADVSFACGVAIGGNS